MIILLMMLSCYQLKAQIIDKETQINAATLAAPEEQRAGAKVLGFNDKGELSVLREGTNNLICLSDDPNKEGFSVACYHKDLEPFMKRGRELQAMGKSRGEIFEIRAREVEDGKLTMPEYPSTLHVYGGAEATYDTGTGAVKGATLRYVVYIPYATAESTGLPIRPMVPGGPWIMDPGTHRAHIMITPPVEDK